MTELTVQTDLTLILPDRVGSLAETLRKLADAQVNIVGHGGFPAWEGEGLLHLIVEDVEAALAAMVQAGIEVREERQVLVVPVDSVPGSLAAAFERIAGVGVNIDLTYSLADGRVAIGVNNLERALRALGSD